MFRGLMNGLIVGAILTYLFDPNNGKGRRAMLRDKMTKARNDMSCAANKFMRDKRNRMQGVMHDAKDMLKIKSA